MGDQLTNLRTKGLHLWRLLESNRIYRKSQKMESNRELGLNLSY